jgi:prevent-host-death family protein
MERVGVRRLRERLSEYLDRVERGDRIEVTDRGRAVARLVPPSTPDDPLERLIADGVVQPPANRGGLHGLATPQGSITDDATRALDALREERT